MCFIGPLPGLDEGFGCCSLSFQIIYARLQKGMRTHDASNFPLSLRMYAHTYLSLSLYITRTYIYIYICIYVYACMYVDVSVHTSYILYTYMYAYRTQSYMCVYTHMISWAQKRNASRVFGHDSA